MVNIEFGTQQVVDLAGQLMRNGNCPRGIDALLQHLGEKNAALNPVARAIRAVSSKQYGPYICGKCDRRDYCPIQSQQQPLYL